LRGAKRRSNLDRLSTTGARLLRFARNDGVSRAEFIISSRAGRLVDLLAAARARLEAEGREQTTKLAKVDHQTAQKRAEEAQIEAEIAKYDAALPLVQGRADIHGSLLKTQFGNKIDYLQSQQQLVEMQHERIAEQKKRDEVEGHSPNWPPSGQRPRPSSSAPC
jgi:hypothetical protein